MANIDGFKLITKVFRFVFTRAFLISVLILTFIAFVISLFNRYIYIDDAFFGEQAYWLAKSGIVKVPSMLDFIGWENHLLSYHKLTIFIGAGLIKLFWWSITPLRSISLLFTLGLIVSMYYYMKSKPEFYQKGMFLLVLFFFFVNPLIIWYSFTYRPEIWVAFFGFLSYIFINKVIYREFEVKHAVLAGVFAGLAFLTHLNGLIFPVAGFFLLIIYKKFKSLLLYVIAGGFVGLLYFWDLWQNNNFTVWLYQLNNWPDANATTYMSDGVFDFIKNIINKLLSEHQRFFWSYKVWALSLFFLFTVITNWKNLYKQHRVLLLYTLILIITLNVAGGQIAERFMIYFIPFFSLIITIDIAALLKEGFGWRKGVFILLLLLQLVFVVQHLNYIYIRNGDYVENTTQILSKIEDKEGRVLVPYEFVFNGLETHNLASFKGFEYHEVRINHKLTQEEFFNRAHELQIKYIVLPYENKAFKYNTIDCLRTREIIENNLYTPFYRDNSVLILKAIL